MPFGEESQAICTATPCNYCLKTNPQGCSFPITSTPPVSEKGLRHGNSMAAGHHPVHPKMQSQGIYLGGVSIASATPILSFSLSTFPVQYYFK